MNKPNTDWKDHELDTIWNHGVKKYVDGKIDQYVLLNVIEHQMEKAIKRILSSERENLRRKIEGMKRSVSQDQNQTLYSENIGFNNALTSILSLLDEEQKI